MIGVPHFDWPALQEGLHQEELRDCLQTFGAFYLTGVPSINDQVHRRPREEAMRLFLTATEEEKVSITIRNPLVRRGFSALGAESTAKVTNTGEYEDYSMCFSMGLEDNLFPNATFESVWTEYFRKLFEAAKTIGRVVLKTVVEPARFEQECMESVLDCDPILRFRNFPEVPESRAAENQPLRMAPHYDISIITLIHQTPCKNGFVSLQIQDASGNFVDVPPKNDAILVMCGAVGTILGNGRIKAPIHRVLAPPRAKMTGSARTSSVFFMRPKADFEFDVGLARNCGLNVTVPKQRASFQEWIGGNYKMLGTN